MQCIEAVKGGLLVVWFRIECIFDTRVEFAHR